MTLTNSKKHIKVLLSSLLAIALIATPLQSLNLTTKAYAKADSGMIYVEDNFDYEEGTAIHNTNGWISVIRANLQSHLIEDGKVKVVDYSGNDGWRNNVMLRPMSEAAVNQRVTVENANLGSILGNATTNIHLRYINNDGANEYTTKVEPKHNYIAQFDNTGVSIVRATNAWSGKTTLAEKVTYKYVYGHRYRLEFSAIGIKPTVLTAKVYDVTDGNKVVAVATAEDSTADLQRYGTVGLSHTRNGEADTANRHFSLFDNFVYEEVNTEVFSDNFNRTDEIGNNWNVGEYAVTSLTGTALTLQNSPTLSVATNGTLESANSAALVRPISEATLNSEIELDYSMPKASDGKHKDAEGAVIYSRIQGDRPTDENCYRLAIKMTSNGSVETLYLFAGTQQIWTGTYQWADSHVPRKLCLLTESISETETKLTVYSYKYDGNVWKIRVEGTVTDSTAALQNPGTAGFSIYKTWNSSVINVDNFKYSVPATTTHSFAAKNESVFKNQYTADAVQTGTASVSEAQMGTSLDHSGAYIAYQLNAPEAGNYAFRANLKMSGADATAYANTAKYAMLVANGKAYKLNYYGAQGVYADTVEAEVELNAGANTVYLMAPTAELTAELEGLKIDYAELCTEDTITAVEGTLIAAGDANGDNTFDIKDLIRIKRFFADNAKTSINYDAIEVLVGEADDEQWEGANTVATLSRLLLSIGTIDEVYNPMSWLRFIEPRNVSSLAVINDMVGGADDLAETKKTQVLNATNGINLSGKNIYYISNNGDDSKDGKSPANAWKTLEKLNDVTLNSGDVVLLERGSIFRQENTVYDYDSQNYMISAKTGVSYGAYGTGAKPVLSGSSYNYAEKTWTQYSDNIWVTDLPLQDAGNIVFDDGTVGVKIEVLNDTPFTYSSGEEIVIKGLDEGNEFYHDVANGKLYLYCAEGNPAVVFRSIEIGCDRPIISFNNGINNVYIDNLDIRNTGGHAIDGYENNSNIHITNCEISWAGGSYQILRSAREEGPVRYGNGVQFWSSASNIYVQNCWVHDVYDAGLTFQGNSDANYNTIQFTNNLIQRCNYSVEFFIKPNADSGTHSGTIDNIDINNNIMQFAGYGFTQQRGDKIASSHICGWGTDLSNQTNNFNITNNTFDMAFSNIVYFENTIDNATVTISANTYYKTYVVGNDNRVLYYGGEQYKGTGYTALEDAILDFGDDEPDINWFNYIK